MIPAKPNDVTWTDEQWEAIYEDNKNIIVSAGAGSGKTAVLTERVIRKLKDGVHIDELLILTFTKAAASEMADRIRKKIKKIPSLSSELTLLNSAYITTFDSFALSIVKKYHYLINISDKVNIIDNSVISIVKNEVMNDIFLELYDLGDESFLKMIKLFCVKDDIDIRNYILNISNKLDLLSNKSEYLDKYVDLWFCDNKIDDDINSYYLLIRNKIDDINYLIEEISYIDNDFANKITDSLNYLFNSCCYDDLVNCLNIKLPIAPRGSDSELKELKANINSIIKDIKAMCSFNSSKDIKDTIMLTRDTVSVIIRIILEFDKRISKYKRDNNSYEFSDIAIMAINILKDNVDIRNELINSFNEIMVDEYQDTNDLQEEFISLMSNNNVYMVGDIKQSIYRFRNANPYIFKNKYDSYSVSNKDKKIDLNKNFRSRLEVLDNINKIFNLIMSDSIGGADYLASHQMIFSNSVYSNNVSFFSNDMDIYSYNYNKDSKYTKDEIEAFIIANDIKNKISNNYQVLDKDSNTLRNISYGDFAIIMDRATCFDLYKKVFSYMGIPIVLYKDEQMNDNDDINVLRNIIMFIIKIKNKEFDVEFRYLFVSIMRSFLFGVNDDIIFKYFVNNSFFKSDLYLKCLSISKKIDYITIHELLDIIVLEFNYYDKLITIGNIDNNMVKLDRLYEIVYNLEDLGYDIFKFSSYLSLITDSDYSMSYHVTDTSSNAVCLMTIHKSKGLEYPLCYFSGLYKKFNISDLKEKFLWDKNYGIILPYFKNGVGETIYKSLVKDNYLKDEISEKIRLFYVALTRAREKMILLTPISDKVNLSSNSSVLDDRIKAGYRSLSDIINSIYFRVSDNYKTINLDDIGISRDYNLIKIGNYSDNIGKCDIKLDVSELSIDNSIINYKVFSHHDNNLISKEDYDNMHLGTKLHNVFELIDLKNPNYDLIDNFSRDIVKSFLDNDVIKNIDMATIYKEYEFIYCADGVKYHGIIDLLLVYEDHIDIIDYKLKNTFDDNYNKQLIGYKNYISTKSDKHINIYLYSLLDKKIYSIV